LHVDWKSKKDIETGFTTSNNPTWMHSAHDCGVHTMLKSPFIDDIFVTIGGWDFSIWRQSEHLGPLFHSPVHHVKLTCGWWSPTRAGVLFVGRSDGNVDVWDFLDKSHEPFLTQNITGASIKSMEVRSTSKRQQLLAVGDGVGTIHTFQIPWSLRRSPKNEQSLIKNFFDTQQKRLHSKERQGVFTSGASGVVYNENELSRSGEDEGGIFVGETDEDWEKRARVEYEQYLAFEQHWLAELGIVTRVV